MFYESTITVPANTLSTAPLVSKLELTHGVLNHVEIEFESGCHKMVKGRLMYQGVQLFPTNRDGYFSADGYVIKFDDWFELDSDPYDLEIHLWSDNTTYSHDITVRIGVIDNTIAKMIVAAAQGLQKLLQLVGVG